MNEWSITIYVFKVKLDTKKNQQPRMMGYRELLEGKTVSYLFLQPPVWH